MRFLLIPENNSLSHIAKCLAIRMTLADRGHEVLVAANGKHSRFLSRLGVDCSILSDIQEIDGAPFPTTLWFKHPPRVTACIEEEVALLKSKSPDRILGVFRFTTKAAAMIAGIPYDSLICGCMLPDSPEVLGYADRETGIDLQYENLTSFYRYAAKKISLALASLGLSEIKDIRYMLKGDRTFLWDFPEFLPLELDASTTYVGPIWIDQWPRSPLNLEWAKRRKKPLAVITFGTCTLSPPVAEKIVRILLDLDYDVLIAAGGQAKMMDIMAGEPRVRSYAFVPLPEILPHASLLVCHGGQMTVFDALQHRVPVVVMPFQPEQAHNGVCLERLGCGCRMIPPQPFRQNPGVYIEAFNRLSDTQIKSSISHLTETDRIGIRLKAVKQLLDGYDGAETTARLLEES